MSSNDKRRRARVQGSWAAPPRRSSDEHKKERKADTQQTRRSAPGAFSKSTAEENTFTFVDPGEVKTAPPTIKIENEEPDYILSTEPSGVSTVRYYPKFIPQNELAHMFHKLEEELPWEEKYGLSHAGERYLQPRLITWFGDLPYSYSGVVLEPNPEWHPLLVTIREDIEEKVGHRFNSVLGNFYRDEKDGVEWHSDDEKSLGENPFIASISLGELRNFEMRKNPPPEENGDYTYQQQVKIPLRPGSLLTMEGATQTDWQHRIPKEYHSRGPRINLTFRNIFPE